VIESTTLTPIATIGIDLGDRTSQACVLDNASGDVISRFGFESTVSGLERRFTKMDRGLVVLEAGGHSPWASRAFTRLGFRVIVANPRKVRAIATSERKSDRVDAETLARLGRADERLLHPIQHRDARHQEHIGVLRARDQVVHVRTAMINHVRGRAKSAGMRLPDASAEAFADKAAPALPDALRPALEPVLDLIRQATATIRTFDKQVAKLGEDTYPETQVLQQVHGVGPVTSLAFVLVLGDRDRFRHSRDVGAYLGLCPRVHQSGDINPQLSITKAGDRFLRRLLVGSAHYILGPFGPDCTLRRLGKRLMERGAGNAKKRAVVAVARQLAVLLHHLWKTGEVYEPLRGSPPLPPNPT